MSDTATVTPWSTASQYATGYPSWVPEEDQERIQAYLVYHNLYWSEDRAVEVARRSEDGQPIYVPKPKMVVDTTAHYLLKGLTIGLPDSKEPDKAAYLKAFLDREAFLAKFNVAKLKGVALGDWLLHITANPDKAEGSRISISTVDPAAYFPEYDDEEDPDRLTGVKLVEPWADPEDPSKTLIMILRYFYNLEDPTDNTVWREQNLWEIDGWNNPKKAKLRKAILEIEPLPEDIKTIPVYHFKNADWDGYQFGNSELKGVERLFQAIDQAVSDEELALALVGLGVYATDAGRPVVNGKEVDWVISPGVVLEVPGATMIKRLEGITSVTPVQDHLEYLDGALREATQTSDVVLGDVDAQVAESGIALAIKFLPTAAKLEYRDQAGLAVLTQFWYDMKAWFKAYEGFDFGDTEIVCRIGDKLPVNRTKVLEELNNMKDRGVISAAFYREEAARRLGYVFPENEAQRILDEKKAEMELLQQFKPVNDTSNQDQGNDTVDKGNQSNNKDKVNESNGTEADDS